MGKSLGQFFSGEGRGQAVDADDVRGAEDGGGRAAHGVADDGEAHAPLALDDVPYLVGVEAALGVEGHAGAGEEHVAHAPLRSTVHQRSDDEAGLVTNAARAVLIYTHG